MYIAALYQGNTKYKNLVCGNKKVMCLFTRQTRETDVRTTPKTDKTFPHTAQCIDCIGLPYVFMRKSY